MNLILCNIIEWRVLDMCFAHLNWQCLIFKPNWIKFVKFLKDIFCLVGRRENIFTWQTQNINFNLNPSFCRSYLIVYNEVFIKQMLKGAIFSILTLERKLYLWLGKIMFLYTEEGFANFTIQRTRPNCGRFNSIQFNSFHKCFISVILKS